MTMRIQLDRKRLLAMAAAIAALTGCDGGSYDATAGRFAAAEQGARDLGANAAQRPSDDGQPQAAGAHGLPFAAHAQGAPEQARAPEAREYAEARRAAVESGTFDPFSRTPPAPTAQPGAQPAEPTKPQIAAVSPSSGPVDGDNEVLVTGSGFAGVQVMWGGQLARVTSQSSNAVTVIVPAGRLGPVPVVVTNRDGTYTVVGNGYQYR
jgi:hypothetical protein